MATAKKQTQNKYRPPALHPDRAVNSPASQSELPVQEAVSCLHGAILELDVVLSVLISRTDYVACVSPGSVGDGTGDPLPGSALTANLVSATRRLYGFTHSIKQRINELEI